MKRVVIESPLKGSIGDYETNRAYAKACMRDSILRGESPYASHLLFAQAGILDDTLEEERKLGMEAGFEWGRQADMVAVYTDRGISDGMKRGIESAEAAGIPIEYREGIEVPEQSPREAFLKGLAAEPEGTRFFAVAIDPEDGDMSQRLIGPFQIYELQGIARFLSTQFDMAASNMIARGGSPFDDESDEDTSDRVVG